MTYRRSTHGMKSDGDADGETSSIGVQSPVMVYYISLPLWNITYRLGILYTHRSLAYRSGSIKLPRLPRLGSSSFEKGKPAQVVSVLRFLHGAPIMWLACVSAYHSPRRNDGVREGATQGGVTTIENFFFCLVFPKTDDIVVWSNLVCVSSMRACRRGRPSGRLPPLDEPSIAYHSRAKEAVSCNESNCITFVKSTRTTRTIRASQG